MKLDLIQKLKTFFLVRQQAYWQVFNKENVFTEPVLKDLAKFCRAEASTFHADPRIHAMLEGRREVYLRICHHLNLSPEDFFKIYGVNEDA